MILYKAGAFAQGRSDVPQPCKMPFDRLIYIISYFINKTVNKGGTVYEVFEKKHILTAMRHAVVYNGTDDCIERRGSQH